MWSSVCVFLVVEVSVGRVGGIAIGYCTSTMIFWLYDIEPAVGMNPHTPLDPQGLCGLWLHITPNP